MTILIIFLLPMINIIVKIYKYDPFNPYDDQKWWSYMIKYSIVYQVNDNKYIGKGSSEDQTHTLN